jgi:Na+/alanine symporter
MVRMVICSRHHFLLRFINAGVQANSIGASLEIAFGLDPNVTAALLAVLLSFIIFGGVKRIASFSSMVVPFMALGYIIVACVIIAINITELPGVILLIWKSASALKRALARFWVRRLCGALSAASIPTKRHRGPDRMLHLRRR